MDIRIGGLLQPAATGKLQPAITRTAAISVTIFEEATNLVEAFLMPAAVIAFVMAIWRLGADVGLTGDFIVSTGLFSHWQVWIMLALVLKMTGSLIHRTGEPTGPGAKSD